MRKNSIPKLLELAARHPGLIQKVDKMFGVFASLREVEAMIRGEFGEDISRTAVRNYKRNHWTVRRDRERAISAALTARQELQSEGRI